MSPLSRRSFLPLLAAVAAAGCGSDPSATSAPTASPAVSAAPASPAAARDLRGIVYTSQPRPLRLDLYLPAGMPPFPLVVWVHGGGWQSGDRALPAGHAALRQRERGYAVASIEYRLSGEALFPAQIQDCKAALRYLRANAATHGLATDRVAAWGSSAGGHLVALLGTSDGVAALEDPGQGHVGQSSRVQAVVDWFGPTDFLLQPAAHHLADSPESRLLGCDIDECPERVALANPVSHVDAADPAFFIQHGTRDGTVDIAASELMHASLLAAGVESTLVRLSGAGHGGPEFNTAANVALIEAFLDRRLGR